MAETPKGDNPIPALGALLSIDGIAYRVHQDCREAREQFEEWCGDRAIAKLDKLLAKRKITPEEYALRRRETINDFQACRYAYGSPNFGAMASTHDGILQTLAIRVKLFPENPALAPAKMEAWLESTGWQKANELMNLADGFAPPKSDTPADGPNSNDSSSGS